MLNICLETGVGSTEDGECSINKIGSSIKSKSRKYRWKLLQFDENKRPPYWGTWRKTSLYIKPKRPFACDKVWKFIYKLLIQISVNLNNHVFNFYIR